MTFIEQHLCIKESHYILYDWLFDVFSKNVKIYIISLKVSLWNTSIMAIQTLIQHYYGSNFGFHCIQIMYSPIVYITLFSCVETILLTAVHGSYISEYFYIILNFAYKFTFCCKLSNYLLFSFNDLTHIQCNFW